MATQQAKHNISKLYAASATNENATDAGITNTSLLHSPKPSIDFSSSLRSTQQTETQHCENYFTKLTVQPPRITTTNHRARSLFTTSRDEMNLAEFPLAVLSTRINPNVKTLEFSDTQKMPNGDLVERQWILTGADKFGLPTATDDDVVLGLICLTMDQGFRDRKVYFTRYELLRILRWSTEGKSYSRVTKSLDRLSGARIRATNAFYDNSLKAYQTKNFGIIDAYELNDERGSQHDPNSFFIWSEVIFDSFKAGFVKKIDLDFYFGLNSSVSRRLYRYLDKHFYYKHTVEKSLTVLAFEKLGLSRTYKYVSSIKQQLTPACEELVATGFLSDFEFLSRGSVHTVRFSKANQQEPSPVHEIVQNRIVQNQKRTQQSQQHVLPHQMLDTSRENILQNVTPTIEKSNSDDTNLKMRNAIHELLSARGLTSTQTSRLIASKTLHDLQQIEKIISYYDHLLSTKDIRVSKNAVGFLYRAVEFPYKFSIPESFVSMDKKQNCFKTSSNFGTATSTRPELKVIRSKSTTQTADALDARLKREYDKYVDAQVAEYAKHIGKEALQAIHTSVETRMQCIKPVLETQRFKDAVNSLVKDELIKASSIISYEKWKMM